jgi:hypothetical protein
MAESPVVVGEPAQPVLLLHGDQEEAIAGSGGKSLVIGRVHFVKRDACRLAPPQRHHLPVAVAHLGGPCRVEPKARLEQTRRLDQDAVAVALVARRRVRDDRLKAPAMSGLALHGGDFRKLGQHALNHGPRRAIALHQVALGDIDRQATAAPVARDRKEQAVGIRRRRLARGLWRCRNRVRNEIATPRALPHQAAACQ